MCHIEQISYIAQAKFELKLFYQVACIIFPLQSELWERGKNRLSITGQRIKAAFSPSHSPSYDNSGSPTAYDDYSSDDASDDEDRSCKNLTESSNHDY